MKTKTKAMILAGVFVITTTLPVTALARRGGAAGGIKGVQGQTQRNERQTRQQKRLRDGSCVNNTGAVSQRQNQTDRGERGTRQRLRDKSCVVPVE